MTKKITLLILMALSACSPNGPVGPFAEPSEKRLSRSGQAVAATSSDNVVISGQTFPASRPGALRFSRIPVCEAASIVLGENLSVPYSCEASGEIAMNFPAVPPRVLFTSFAKVASRIGVSVIARDGTVLVSGGTGGEASAQFGTMPDGLPSGETISEDVQAYTYQSLPDDVERRIVDAQFQTDSLHVRLFSSFGSIDAFDDLVNKLGLDVSGTVSPGGILAIGSVSDISTLQAVADASGSATVPIEVSAVSEQSLEALNASYAGIGFAFDPDNSTLWLTGNADLISEALPAVRSRFTRARDVTVDAVFVAYDQTSVDSFDTELAFNIGSGDASILSGKLPVGTPVSFFVDKLVASGSAAVLSRPSVTTSTGSSARFQSGASVPVIGSIGEEGEQDIAYRDTGVVVSVSPSLLPSGRIRLRITLEVSSVDGLGVSDNPTFTRRVVSSTVEVASGETVALSGLEYQDRSASSADRLFFPSRNSGSSSQSLAFFLTATYDY